MGMGVDVHGVAPEEADQGHAELVGQLDGQAGGRADGGDQGHAGHGRLLDDLEGAPSGHEQHHPGQRQAALGGRPPDRLVDRVVAPDILADTPHGTVGTADGGRVEAAGLLEHPLGLPDPVRDRGQDPGGHGQAVPGQGRAVDRHRVDRRLPADAARRRGDGQPVERRVGDGHAGPQVDGEHVELLGLALGSAEADRLHVVGTGHQPFADAVPDGQLDVVAGGAHRHPDRPPRHPQLQRLLHRQPVPGPPGLAPGRDLQHPALGNPPTRHRRLPSSAVPSRSSLRAPPPGRRPRRQRRGRRRPGRGQTRRTLAGTRWAPKNADSRYSTSTGRPSSSALVRTAAMPRSCSVVGSYSGML